MKLTESKKTELIKKILFSRLRILNDYGFYGLLLMHMNFGLDEACQTAYTDGYKIAFSPAFLESLSNTEIDFIMMHEIMHVCLKHCFRGSAYDQMLFNVACDIVVNSNILESHNMDLNSISINGSDAMHLAPNGNEGHLYTAEEVYEMLKNTHKSSKLNSKGNIVFNGCAKGSKDSGDFITSVDDHTHWAKNDCNQKIDEWDQRLINALEANRIREKGNVPKGVLREYDKLTDATIDWRLLLKQFVSFEVSDYSFNPPDRRYDGTDFYLPDFNDVKEVTDINILFEIDTSASMSNKEIALAYSEIKGAIEAYDGGIKGWLGFYDTDVSDIRPFSDVDDLIKIRPIGGGGTDCSQIFSNLKTFERIVGSNIDAIIIITDGYDDYPSERVRQNIPVFWLITNKIQTPPWGVVARIKTDK